MDYYTRLGTYRSASLSEVKLAYGKLARQLHPDLFANDPAKASKMAVVNVAYNTLKTVASRRQYDAYMKAAHKQCLRCHGAGAVMKQKGFARKVAAICEACQGSGVAS